MRTPPLLSVIVPTHKRPHALARVLDGLRRQTFPAHDLEVIVVMDGACAETQQLPESGDFPYALRWFVQPARGAPAARNLGIAQAGGELLVFLDDDVIPVPDLLALHWRRHAQEGRRVVFGGLKPSPDSPQRFMAEVANWTLAHFNRCSAPGYQPSHIDLPDGNMSARRDDILKAGGWDESFVGFGGDDDRELGLRLARLGLQFEFEPQALGYHFFTKSWDRFLADRRQAGRAHRYYMSKHPDRVREFLFTVWATGFEDPEKGGWERVGPSGRKYCARRARLEANGYILPSAGRPKN